MRTTRLAQALIMLALGAAPSFGEAAMYGSTSPTLGITNPIPGALLIVAETDGAGTLVGDPVTPGGVSGLAFDSAGGLFGSTRQGGGVPGSDLVQIDPDNGTLLANLGAIVDGVGADVGISDLSFQPGTDVLFGISSFEAPCSLCLYTIDATTTVATLVGDPGLSNGGLAFAPAGTLYLATSSTPIVLAELDPANGSVLGSVAMSLPLDGLGIRGDGTFYGTGPALSDDIVTIDPATGTVTIIGQTGAGSTTDLDFRPATAVPALGPGGFVLLGLLLGGIGATRRGAA